MSAERNKADSDRVPSRVEAMARDIVSRRYRTKLLRLLEDEPFRFSVFAEDGRWVRSPIERWSDGFWAGIFWLAWSSCGDAALRQAAEDCLTRLAPRLEGADANYDLGFLYFYSFALAHRLTGEERCRATALAAARRLCDFRTEPAGVITIHYPERVARFGAERVTTKIDVMMNLSLLWWAGAQTGERRFRDVAEAHARRSLDCLLRADGSVWELADFDPQGGALLRLDTAQGLEGESCWARAQAWAIYGFLQSARFTGEAEFHAAALRALDFWRRNTPADGVPYWDLTAAPEQCDARDASAAAIVLAALVQARDWGLEIPGADGLLVGTLEGLTGFLADDEEEGVLNGGCAYYRRREGLFGATVWGDYYLLQALSGLASQQAGSNC